MTPQEAVAAVKKRLADLERFRREDLPDIIKDEAVDFYQDSFYKQGATDKELKKWDDVKRRDPDSPWYGFSLGDNSPRPVKIDESGKKIKSTSKAKATNFSEAMTTKGILIGKGRKLLDSITATKKADRVTIGSDLPYSRVHNFGEQSYIFGKKAFNQKARPFIYPSAVLNKAIYDKVAREMKRQGLIK